MLRSLKWHYHPSQTLNQQITDFSGQNTTNLWLMSKIYRQDIHPVTQRHSDSMQSRLSICASFINKASRLDLCLYLSSITHQDLLFHESMQRHLFHSYYFKKPFRFLDCIMIAHVLSKCNFSTPTSSDSCWVIPNAIMHCFSPVKL